MRYTPEMFSGRSLNLWLGVRGHSHVDVDMRPDEAIELLDRLEAPRTKAGPDERLSHWAYEDRQYRIGWERATKKVEVQVRPGGIAWRFRVSSDDGPVWIQTKTLERNRILAGLLRKARPEPFRRKFEEFAKRRPRTALEALEEWLDLDMPGSKTPAEVVPLTEEDIVPILNAEDPDVRQRAMAALGRLDAEAGDDLHSDAA